jgi:hypothetical protein
LRLGKQLNAEDPVTGGGLASSDDGTANDVLSINEPLDFPVEGCSVVWDLVGSVEAALLEMNALPTGL